MPSTFTLVTESAHSVEELFDVSLDIDAHVANTVNGPRTCRSTNRTGRSSSEISEVMVNHRPK